jgi:hypothetical protein
LGARLGLNQQTQELRSSVPSEVLEAAQLLWAHALEHAQQSAEQAMQAREEAMQSAQYELQAQQAKLIQREEGVAQQKIAMDAALQLAQAQGEDLARRLQVMQSQLAERDELIERLRQENTKQRQSQESLRDQHTRELEAAANERQRLAEQFAGNERRMMAELDRSRQEGEKLKKVQADNERATAARMEEMQSRYLQSEEALLTERAGHIHLHQSLKVANERWAELKSLLELQQSAQQAQTQALPTPSAAGDLVDNRARGARSLQRRALSQRSLRLPRK